MVEDYVLIYTNSVVRTYAHVGKRAHLGSTLTIGNNVNVPDDSWWKMGGVLTDSSGLETARAYVAEM